jgi:hypothetical protein
LDLLGSDSKKEKLDIRQTSEGNMVVGLKDVVVRDKEQVRVRG